MGKVSKSKPASLSLSPKGYTAWLKDIKSRIYTAQQRAALAVNRELIALYWQIGHDILSRQAKQGWGAKVIERLAHDLTAAFPEMKGFSRANLMYMRAFAEAWTKEQIVQQAVGRLPWGHNLVLLSKLKTQDERLAYAGEALNKEMKREQDTPTIGLLLCKSKNKVVAEYALQDNSKPIGIAEYQLAKSLPKELKTNLPSIEQIEKELKKKG